MPLVPCHFELFLHLTSSLSYPSFTTTMHPTIYQFTLILEEDSSYDTLLQDDMTPQAKRTNTIIQKDINIQNLQMKLVTGIRIGFFLEQLRDTFQLTILKNRNCCNCCTNFVNKLWYNCFVLKGDDGKGRLNFFFSFSTLLWLLRLLLKIKMFPAIILKNIFVKILHWSLEKHIQFYKLLLTQSRMRTVQFLITLKKFNTKSDYDFIATNSLTILWSIICRWCTLKLFLLIKTLFL